MGGNLVPALAVGRVCASHAAVQDSALQRRVHLSEGHKLGFGAHPVYPVGNGCAVAAGLLSLEVLRGRQRFATEEELVNAHVPVVGDYWRAAAFIGDHPLEVRSQDGCGVVLGLVVFEHAPQALNFQGWDFAGHVASVNLRDVQSAVPD